ncbi:hypothetical protein [Pseudomonas sp. MS19]|uniref:hypothetical protein n=1 Tax=Pseudomonas sp. MS19 TaxID=2579939 RepID=UPI001561F353|nr:hypothetical protein [Pseudomonas sp. MS19]NRH27240.1 hypothetical protein [Pseudomonas sp. MS19]
MQTTSVVLIVATLLLGVVLFNPRLTRLPMWRATVTPLASIIGSGFLVAGPILAHAVGIWAWLAMLALCGMAYWFGAAIRYNIVYLEPRLADQPGNFQLGLERLSDLALALAYFVSVAYYLNLFAAFGLRLGEILDPFWIRTVSTVVIALIGVLGAFGGLSGLERLEVWVVSLKLTLIGGLLVLLAYVNFEAWQSSELVWAVKRHDQGWESFSVLLGLVILVQGFETSRYLGSKYSAKVRVRSMHWAQWIATAIYLLFLLLITSQFSDGLPKQGSETAIIDTLKPIGVLVAPLLILTALSSQLSAAVADMNGAGGLLSEVSKKHVSVRVGNVVTALVAIAITWFANIFEIITYASKVFVAYYALQSLQAAYTAWQNGHKGRAALFAVAVMIGVIVIIFAKPVET